MVVLIYLAKGNRALGISSLNHNEDAFDNINKRLVELTETELVTIINKSGIYQYDVFTQDMQRVG